MTGRPCRAPTSQSSRIRESTLDVALRAIAGVVGWKLASVRLAMAASSRYLIGFIWLTISVWPSLDHLIRPLQERRRDREAEGLRGLEVERPGCPPGSLIRATSATGCAPTAGGPGGRPPATVTTNGPGSPRKPHPPPSARW